jgi:flagellar hook-basal body complex protein FliE
MAFFPIDRNANSSNNVLEMKSILVRGLAVAEQMQRESGEMTEAQMQAQYGITATTAEWNGVLNGVVTAMQAAAIETYISSLG